ncbi:hypothetical protein FCIRC_6098 [Fusarium circinatum]|uniref:DUF6546 domain-containing protein n=1 Tax=Fusarium circinatum TaxID=48490 RepID=A0A8H5U1L2_FUSCI|nr:hypothetical protein FCIRC_6098 [Fusarium circinatum]
MRLRSSGCLRWSYLPQEVRRNILHAIVDQRNLRWSALASVSKEWQSVIGTRNMAKLNLRPSCLEDFEQTVVRQRDLKNESLSTYSKNNLLLASAVKRILIILSTWNTTGSLTLELNAASASDPKHWFKNFRFDDEHDTPYNQDLVAPVGAVHNNWHDPKHGWENGVQVQPPPFKAMQRLFGLVDLAFSPLAIPKVNAITCLMIRRQFRHCFMPRQLDSILSKLDRLTDLIYEPWLLDYTDTGYQGYFERRDSIMLISLTIDHLGVIGMPLPSTLERLILFQDAKLFLKQSVHQDPAFLISLASPGYTSMDDTLSNSENLAQTSLRLRELAVSFLVGAMDFFRACKKEWTWIHLQSLSLTSSLLLQNTKEQRGRIDSLLITAARFLLRMPNLTTMVLWSGGTGKACAFMYIRAKHYAHITWRGTWDLEISRQVLKAWEDVAKLHSVELRVRHERLHETIRSHGDAIFHLNLPCQVIEPTSLWQIRVEDAQGL